MSKAPDNHGGIESNPYPGQFVLFRYAGGWSRGEVVDVTAPLRVSLRRSQASTPRERRRLYKRNRTQIYRP